MLTGLKAQRHDKNQSFSLAHIIICALISRLARIAYNTCIALPPPQITIHKASQTGLPTPFELSFSNNIWGRRSWVVTRGTCGVRLDCRSGVIFKTLKARAALSSTRLTWSCEARWLCSHGFQVVQDDSKRFLPPPPHVKSTLLLNESSPHRVIFLF